MRSEKNSDGSHTQDFFVGGCEPLVVRGGHVLGMFVCLGIDLPQMEEG